ncbi:hypothetical protein [Allochromatium warmingii]|nr:hypothetical protein [Allochromatium warmingii]
MDIEQEIWATEEVDLKELERYTDLMSLSGPDGLLANSDADRAQQAEMDKVKGYPILTKFKMQLMGTDSAPRTLQEVKFVICRDLTEYKAMT